jgi:hypothetical protein
VGNAGGVGVGVMRESNAERPRPRGVRWGGRSREKVGDPTRAQGRERNGFYFIGRSVSREILEIRFHSSPGLLSPRRQKPQPNKNTSSSEARGRRERGREKEEEASVSFLSLSLAKEAEQQQQQQLVGCGACELQLLLRRRQRRR